MRLVLFGLILSLGMAGCTTAGPEAPVDARTVNAEIEQRIARGVEKGKERDAPDLSAIPTKAPKTESPSVRAGVRQKLLQKAGLLKEKFAKDTAEVMADKTALEKAEEIKAAIARDRAAIAAEKRLSENIPPRP